MGTFAVCADNQGLTQRIYVYKDLFTTIVSTTTIKAADMRMYITVADIFCAC